MDGLYIAEASGDAYRKAGKRLNRKGWIAGFMHGLVFAKQLAEKNGVDYLVDYVSPLLKKDDDT